MQETPSSPPDRDLLAACTALGGRRGDAEITRSVVFDFAEVPPQVGPGLTLLRLEFTDGEPDEERENFYCILGLRHSAGCAVDIGPHDSFVRVLPDGRGLGVKINAYPHGLSDINGERLSMKNAPRDFTRHLRKRWAAEAGPEDAKLVQTVVNDLARAANLSVFPFCHFPRAFETALRAEHVLRQYFKPLGDRQPPVNLPAAGLVQTNLSFAHGKA